MHRFHTLLKRHRFPVLVVTALTAFFGAEGHLWAEVTRYERAETKRLAQMAERLGVPAERLERQEAGLVESFRNLLPSEEEELRERGLARLEARVDEMEADVAANPFDDRIEEVKADYAPARAEAFVRTLAEIGAQLGVETASDRTERRGSRTARALLTAIRSELEAELSFEPSEDVPGAARQRGERLQGRLNALLNQLRPILNAPRALLDERIERTVERVAAAVDGEVGLHRRPPRFGDGPLPIQRIEREAPTAEAGSESLEGTASAFTPARESAASATEPKAASILPEIQALAAELETPAKIFAHVHDTVRFDPKWGAVRGPLGTLLEGEGTAWDQAWLLRDLLTAAGIDVRFEWGDIEIPVELLTNLTGVSDPFRAGDLLTTGGVPTLLLVEGGRVVGAKLSHVWVKAHVDYIPNRGATLGTPDSWIRMDPSLKRTSYQDGLFVHDKVPFALGSYLRSGTGLSPWRTYEDALWAYIRAKDINCTTLEQLKHKPTIIKEAFPILPGTLRGKILSVAGEAADVPAGFQHRVRLEARSVGGETLLSREIPWPSAWGQRVEIAYRGATADDQATIDSYGGIFETPPYLVDLVPVVKLAGSPVAEGAPIGSAEDVEVRITLVETSGFETVRTHQTLAGEHHALAVDFGRLPQEMVDRHREAYAAAVAAGDEETAGGEELHVLGAQYLHELGEDLTDLAGWKHHRLVRVGTEALVSQSGEVSTTVGGTPVSLTRAERFIDVAGTTLGLFHVDGDDSFRRETFELLVSQGSFLEGQIFAQVLEQRGVSAVAALTESKRRGQALTRVNSGSVATVLGQVDLATEVEQEVEAAVARGRIAWVAEAEITVDQWTGTGYVLEDPETGAAGYLISGGLAGGSETGAPLDSLQDLLGSEDWLEGSPLGELLRQLLDLLGGGDVDGDDGPSTQKSDPINLSTGNLWRTETDLTIQARGLPIVWSRTYNFRSTHNGAVGYGWTFSYGESLTERADGSVLYREADGTEHVFAPDGSGGYMAPPGKHLTLTQEPDGFRMRTDTRGQTTTFTFDTTQGSLESQTDPAGNTTTMITDTLGRVTEITDPEGNTMSIAWDGRDRLVGATDPFGNTTSITYDPAGRQTAMTTPRGTSTTDYDAAGRSIASTDPLGNTTRTEYDAAGNPVARIDAKGNRTATTYDPIGRVAARVDPLGNTTLHAYDALGNLTRKTNADGEVITYEYDVRRRTAVVLPDGTRETFTYDALGRRTGMENSEVSLSMVYDALNRVTEATNHTLGETISYSYDANGNRTGMTGPMGEIAFVHDAANRLVTQTDPATGTYRLGYDAAGRRTRLEYPNGVTTEYDYDSASRLLLLLTRDPQGNTLDGYRYTYDSVGNRTSIRSLRDDGLHEYDYDQVDRLTRWDRGPDRFEAYTYDEVGNRLQLEDERGTVRYSYDDANRLVEEIHDLTDGAQTTRTYSWDPKGNLTEEAVSTGSVTTYTWDALNRLTRLDDPSGTHTYGYDPTGIRVRETNDSTTTRFLHAGDDILAAYQDGTVDTYYTHGPGIDEPWAQVDSDAVAENQLAYLHRDGLGSVTAISKPNAQLRGTTTYAAFGSVESTTGLQTRYGYTSRELDPTGLMYYRARYYQPGTGRFASQDPERGFKRQPPSFHLYQYVENSPTSLTDPSGRAPRTKDAVVAGYLAIMQVIIAVVAACHLRGYALDCFLIIAGWAAALRGFGAAAVVLSRAAVILSFAFLVAGFWYEYSLGNFTGDELVFIVGWLFNSHLAILLTDWVLSRVVPTGTAAVTAAGLILLGATTAVVEFTRRIVRLVEAGELRD